MDIKNSGKGEMNVGGKVRPFQVNGIYQTSIFCQQLGIEYKDYLLKVTQIFNTDGSVADYLGLIALVYSALYSGAKSQRQEIDFDYQNVVDWFDEANTTDVNAVLEFLKPLITWIEIIKNAAKEAEENSVGK